MNARPLPSLFAAICALATCALATGVQPAFAQAAVQPAAAPAAQPPVAPPSAPAFLMVNGFYKDAAVARAYTEMIQPILKENRFQGVITGLAGVNMRVLEGGWIPGAMLFLLRFPEAKDVKSFWWSEAYQKAIQFRAPASRLDVVMLTGTGTTPKMARTSAYLVFTADVKDMPRFLKEYAAVAPAVVQAFGGEFLVRQGRPDMTLMEGSYPPGSVVVIEFPDLEALRKFWGSDEYKRLSEVRKATGNWSVVEIAPRPAPQ